MRGINDDEYVLDDNYNNDAIELEPSDRSSNKNQNVFYGARQFENQKSLINSTENHNQRFIMS